MPQPNNKPTLEDLKRKEKTFKSFLNETMNGNKPVYRVFQTWKTITTDSRVLESEDVCKSIQLAGITMTPSAKNVLETATLTNEPSQTKFELVITSVFNLDFMEDVVLLEDIYAHAKDCGLELCPPEVWVRLCSEYGDQVKDERLTFAMEPLVGLDGKHNIFCLENNGIEKILDTDDGDPETYWIDRNLFVFVRRV